MKKYEKVSLILLVFSLAGCGMIESRLVPQEEVTPSVAASSVESSSESMASVEEVSSTMEEGLPTFDAVETALRDNDKLELGQPLFQTTQQIRHNQQQFDVSIDEMRVYRVKKHAAELASEFNFESQGGAVIVMKVSITNESQQEFYFPIEELRLSFDNATLNTSASTVLYPALSGNLMTQFLETEGLVEGQKTIEGYLVYGVGAQAFQTMQREHYFYLTVVPPRATLGELIGAEGNALGDTVNVFLPLNASTARTFSANSAYIQDRLTTEWWGDKDVLASKALERTQTNRNVDVTLKKVELSDFTPREAYEESFQNFVYGQIIVSVEYEVHNRSRQNVLPIDGGATLTIGEDLIHSDYVLINQKYGQEVKPNETYRVIKTFALDKQRYIDYWQGKSIAITLTVPEDEEISTESSEDDDRVTSRERTYNFEWHPIVTKTVQPADRESE